MAALARKLAPKRKKSRKAPLLQRLQQFPEELLIDHIVVRDRQAMSHTGLHAGQQFFENDAGDRRHVEVGGFLNRDPYEFNQFGVGPNHALDRVRSPASFSKNCWPAWRPVWDMACRSL